MLSRMYAQTSDVNNPDEIKKRFLSKEEYEKQRAVQQQQGRGGGADPNLVRARAAGGNQAAQGTRYRWYRHGCSHR